MRLLPLAFTVLCPIANPAGAEDLGDRLPVPFSLSLSDQYGGRVRFPAPEAGERTDRVTLVVVADRVGAEENRSWAAELARRYEESLQGSSTPRLVILPVAHLEGVPAFLRGIVRRRFAKPESNGDPLLAIGLDWHGDAKQQLGLERGVPNLAVFDTDGTLRLRRAGTVEDAGEEVFGLLDRLLLAR